jgi:hypothetical protein
MASREFLKILSSARLGDVFAQQKLASAYLTGELKTPVQPSNAFIIAAVVTPPDVLSQLLLAIPMIVLYEIGLLAARLYVPKESENQENSASDSSS